MLNKAYLQNRLNEVADAHCLDILFAIESGSRAWGLASTDSDYDVRFVYRREPNWYLDLRKQTDMIGPIMELNGELDLVGWDVRKFLSHLTRSNPNVLEWLASPVTYLRDDKFIEATRILADHCFSPARAYAHYRGIATGAEIKGRQEDGSWDLKKFCYHLRPLLVCEHLFVKPGQRPPIDMGSLTALIHDDNISNLVDALIDRKRQVSESYRMQLSAELTGWVSERWSILSKRAELLKRVEPNWRLANDLFRKTIGLQ